MIDNYNDLTIEKYQQIKAVIDGNEVEEYATNIQLVSILSDMDEDEVGNLPLTEYKKMNEKLVFLMSEPPRRMVADKYKLGNYTLETMLAVDKMTVSQYVDYQTFIKDLDKYLVEMLSIFLIPKGCKYNEGYDIMDVQKVIRENLSIVDAMSLSAFFLLWYQSLTKATLTCLIKKLKKMKKKMKEKEEIAKMEEAIANLERSGDGLHLLIG